MQIRHFRNLINSTNAIAKIQASAWSPSNQKLAIANADRVVILFDENGEKKDKFATKPADPQDPRPYVIVGLCFSPDSTKLAVAQSDGGLYVYRLGLEWGEKKSICNKFIIQPFEITSLVWLKDQPTFLAFGSGDGKVMLGNIKTNKASTICQTESYVIAMTSSPDGNGIASAHSDGSIQLFLFDDGKGNSMQYKLTQHTTLPTILFWTTQTIGFGDIDNKLFLYDLQGKLLQQFDFHSHSPSSPLSLSCVGPGGQTVVIAAGSQLFILTYQSNKQQWIESSPFTIEQYHAITTLAWKGDGSKLVLGSLTGSVDVLDCCLRKSRYKGTFEFTYVSLSQVIVKRISTGSRILLKSNYGYEIQKIHIFQDQFLVAHTHHTLCLGDLAMCKMSEISWESSLLRGQEKFHFAIPGVCVLFHLGEVLLIEYGSNEVLGSCRTEFVNPHLLSVRLNERRSNTKLMAYLADAHTIHIMDLTTSPHSTLTIPHDTKIDWLELSEKGTKLIFRDKKKQLHLIDVATQDHLTLLSYCTYVQWVPHSDVVVAQSRDQLCVWYGINAPDRVTMHPIKGEIQDISREHGATHVIVDEGLTTVKYTLDEGLIEFGTAMDDNDWTRALTLLESLEFTLETEAMWATLSEMALRYRKLILAERCFAALGDVCKAKYLRKVNQLAETLKAADPTLEDPSEHYLIRARLAILEKEYKLAERIYLEQGQTQAAMQMYQDMHQWDAAIRVAELAHHPDLDSLRESYLEWLLESGQEEKAAEFREEEGDYLGAIQLYLTANLPSRAATVLKQKNLLGNLELVERTALALAKAGLWEKAGDFHVLLGNKEKALEAYVKGHCFKSAIDISRIHAPSQVVALEEQWGDYLVSIHQREGAIHHYIEANKSLKALETAIAAKSWAKANSIADTMEPTDPVKKLCSHLADHFQQVNDHAKAEKYFIKAGKAMEAITMYNSLGDWERAYRLASTVLGSEEVHHMYSQLAHEKELKQLYQDAERLYLMIGEPDSAITMYKTQKEYEKMIALVSIYHKELLTETHLFLGRTLENEKSFRQAETHYLGASDWKSAVNMYCANNLYDDAHRVAKLHGGGYAAKQVSYLWAKSLGSDSGAKLLMKQGLLDYAIDFACDNGNFEFAFDLCRFHKDRFHDVYLKQAMYFEDQGNYSDAELAFIKAGKPKEAILMYIHNEQWENAQRVAQHHDPSAVVDVLCGRAKVAFDHRLYTQAESLWLQAQTPELGLKMYQEAGLWSEALTFAKEHVPVKLASVQQEYDVYLKTHQEGKSLEEWIQMARSLEHQGDPLRALEVYLKLNESHCKEPEVLCTHWYRAMELASRHADTSKAIGLAKQVAKQMQSLQCHERAGDVLALTEQYKEACECFALVGQWEKCKQLGRIQPKLQGYIDALYTQSLKRQGKSEALLGLDTDAACQVMVTKGEWEACLNAASSTPSLLSKYLFLFVSHVLSTGQFELAIQAFTKYGTPISHTNSSNGSCDSVTLYLQLFQRGLLEKKEVTYLISQKELIKTMLSDSTLSKTLPMSFKSLLFATHLQAQRYLCSSNSNLFMFRAKQSVALLRYSELPLDQSLYLAGMHCKAVPSMEKMAFCLLNRFLDLSDALEEQDETMLTDFRNNHEFLQTDIHSHVPTSSSIAEEDKEQVRDWVLALSLEKRYPRELDKRLCNCGVQIYEASLICYKCKLVWEPCIVTGYPILNNKTKCSNCNMMANKDDWNRYVIQEKRCPWCFTTQTPAYSLK